MRTSVARGVKRAGVCDEQIHADEGEQQPARAAGEREDQALGDELAQQPPAAGAERRAQRELAIAPHRPRDGEVGDAGADDEEHETGRAHQDEERRFEVPRELAAQRAGGERVTAVRPVGRRG